MEVLLLLGGLVILVWLIYLGFALLKLGVWVSAMFLGKIFPTRLAHVLGPEFVDLRPKKRKRGQIGIFTGSNGYMGGEEYKGTLYHFQLVFDDPYFEEWNDFFKNFPPSSWTFNGETYQRFASRFLYPDAFCVRETGAVGNRIIYFEIEIPNREKGKLREICIPVRIGGNARLVRISCLREYESAYIPDGRSASNWYRKM